MSGSPAAGETWWDRSYPPDRDKTTVRRRPMAREFTPGSRHEWNLLPLASRGHRDRHNQRPSDSQQGQAALGQLRRRTEQPGDCPIEGTPRIRTPSHIFNERVLDRDPFPQACGHYGPLGHVAAPLARINQLPARERQFQRQEHPNYAGTSPTIDKRPCGQFPPAFQDESGRMMPQHINGHVSYDARGSCRLPRLFQMP